MKISIITVCYNSEKTISQTFDSILNQSYQSIEYIVVDGKSLDKTLHIIEKYKSKFEKKGISFNYISEKDNGIYDAMNKGIELSSGDIIGIINSDDWYTENILTKIAEEFKEDLKLEVLYGKTNIVTNEGQFKYIYSPGKLDGLLKTMVIPHPTVFVKKNIYDKFKFNIHNKIASDYEFLLDNYLNGTKFKEVDLVITNFRVGGESAVNRILGFKEVLKIQRRKNIRGIRKYLSFCKKVFKAKIGK